LIKSIDPEIKIMLGGAGFSMFAEKIMERIPEADFGIYLEGEESVPELLNNLNNPENTKGIFSRNNGVLKFTGIRGMPDFTNLPIPRRDLLDITKYLHPKNNNIGIQTKRGCALKCAYCNYQFLNGAVYRLRSPGSIADEIEYLINNFNIRKFTFVDSTFNVPQRHAEGICNEIIKRGLDIQWSAWFDIKHFSEELALLIRKAGCRNIGFSPDAVTDKALSALEKGITEEDIKKSLHTIKKVKGIKAGYNFFITSPGQDFWGFLKTLALLFKIPLTLMGKGGCRLGWIRIEPYTKIYEIAIKEGVINKNTELLPENERQLSMLFYTNPSSKYLDVIATVILDLVEKLLLPTAKSLLNSVRILLKFRRNENLK
ncbi:MAG TPA: B12-binding domain-containing radical SAM protein, partial [Candidatus Wunengus sp. YC60]|uniref:B12-binding domain-containing radical SAM protein n=1 Tax=Candidatus Wunengus sp. YC60 TaxID=3367697 RepID=UPI004027BC3C